MVLVGAAEIFAPRGLSDQASAERPIASREEFKPDKSKVSPFMQRLARAHANCVENLPLFGGLLLIALVTGRTGATDALAPWLLGARLAQASSGR